MLVYTCQWNGCTAINLIDAWNSCIFAGCKEWQQSLRQKIKSVMPFFAKRICGVEEFYKIGAQEFTLLAYRDKSVKS